MRNIVQFNVAHKIHVIHFLNNIETFVLWYLSFFFHYLKTIKNNIVA
jgi:hypothetical protein